eukprot:scaffold114266_cov15-Tisochrysis_lutea.AAC.1
MRVIQGLVFWALRRFFWIGAARLGSLTSCGVCKIQEAFRQQAPWEKRKDCHNARVCGSIVREAKGQDHDEHPGNDEDDQGDWHCQISSAWEVCGDYTYSQQVTKAGLQRRYWWSTHLRTRTDRTSEPLDRARADRRRRMKSRAGSFLRAMSNLNNRRR